MSSGFSTPRTLEAADKNISASIPRRGNRRHHAGERTGSRPNCYIDVLARCAALGHPAGRSIGFTCAGFEGDHFTFFKFPPSDSQKLFGLQREGALRSTIDVEAQDLAQLQRGRPGPDRGRQLLVPDDGAGLIHATSEEDGGRVRARSRGPALGYFTTPAIT